MDVISKENVIGSISSRSVIKAAANQSIKKPALTKKALADVGNILNSAKKKNNQEFSKPGISGQKLDGTKHFKVHVEDEDIIFSPVPKKRNSNRLPLSPISESMTLATQNPDCENLAKGTTMTSASLNSFHHYDSDDEEDGHSHCSGNLVYDDFDDFLPPSLRLNSDDFDSLAMFKPPLKSNLEYKINISAVSDDSDLNDLNVPFPSPPRFSEIGLPFDKFVVPGIDFDDSF